MVDVEEMCMTDVETFRPYAEEVVKAHCTKKNLSFGTTDA